MKPTLPAVIYGNGLLLAFATGWWLKPGTPSKSITSITSSALTPIGTAPAGIGPASAAKAGSMENWIKDAEADLLAVKAARQPGVVNHLRRRQTISQVI